MDNNNRRQLSLPMNIAKVNLIALTLQADYNQTTLDHLSRPETGNSHSILWKI
jgi:hypothetical protein